LDLAAHQWGPPLDRRPNLYLLFRSLGPAGGCRCARLRFVWRNRNLLVAGRSYIGVVDQHLTLATEPLCVLMLPLGSFTAERF